MKTFLRAIIFLALVAVALPASAHVQLSTPLKSRYKLRSVSCAACHVKEEKEKSKDHLTAFGKDIAKIVEGKMISERIADAKEAGSDERKKVLEQIKKEYEKALEKFDKMKAVNGKTYEEALPAGDIEGVKPR